jgi:hypothetical protein
MKTCSIQANENCSSRTEDAYGTKIINRQFLFLLHQSMKIIVKSFFEYLVTAQPTP